MNEYVCNGTQPSFGINEIRAIISSDTIDVVSFDIFDTLLVRPAKDPKDIFVLLQNIVREKFGLNFLELRYHAEEDLGKENALLSEIWDQIARKHTLGLDIARELMQLEIKLEKDILAPRSDVKELYQYALSLGKRIIVTSDMYLPEEVLRDIMESKGFDQIAAYYVSCEYGQRKSTGKLYETVLQKEGIAEPSKMVHIGDNEYSDLKIPLDMGITAVYYPSVWDIAFSGDSWLSNGGLQYEQLENGYQKLVYGFMLQNTYNNGGRWDTCPQCFKDLSMFARMFVAPLAISAVIDMIQETRRREVYNKILFSARDGYLPMKIYGMISDRYQGKLLPAIYLPVSRRALSYSCYKDFFDFMDEGVLPEKEYLLADFIDSVVFDAKLNHQIMASLSSDEKKIDLNADKRLAKKVLSRFSKELQNFFDAQRDLEKRFYSSFFDPPSERSIVFDCGYSGTVSRGLQSICPGAGFVDKYYLWETEKNRFRDADAHTQTFCLFTDMPPVFQLICEEFFSPLTGSCIGFSEEHGRPSPVNEPFEADAGMTNDVEIVQNACIQFCESFLEEFGDYIWGMQFKGNPLFQKIFAYCFLHAPTGESAIFSNIYFPDPLVWRKDVSLADKFMLIHDKHNMFRHVFEGTGYYNINNYAQIPHLLQEKSLGRIGIHVHLFNKYIYQEIIAYLKEVPVEFDLFVTIVSEKFEGMVRNVFCTALIPMLSNVCIYISENRGRDVAPWLILTRERQYDYDLFCHIHAKASEQYGPGVGKRWRTYLYMNLLHPAAVADILRLFSSDAQLGCVFPEYYSEISSILLNNRIPVVGNYGEESMINDMLSRMGVSAMVNRSDMLYSAGTMLWYRPEALKPLFETGFTFQDFPEEPIEVGGTLAHAMERMPSIVAKAWGYKSRIYNLIPNPIPNLASDIPESRASAGPISIVQPFTVQPVVLGLRASLGVFLKKHLPNRISHWLIKQLKLY